MRSTLAAETRERKVYTALNMGEREPDKEGVGRGVLLYLSHPGSERVFSGYGLTVQPNQPDRLVGLLMVDRPHPVDPAWLQWLLDNYGECELYPMTTHGERGLACQMEIEPDSISHLRRFPDRQSDLIQAALEPLLEQSPAPRLRLRWDEEKGYWVSRFAPPYELSPELRDLFERTGYGSLAVESDIGVIHVCHAADEDIAGFWDKPAGYRWQLIEMPTAPLIRLKASIYDQPFQPFSFESFFNVADEEQLRLLAQLAGQEQLYLAFYGDDLEYRFTKILEHDEQQWQFMDEMIVRALAYWEELPETGRDFNKAKAVFMMLS